MNIGSTFFYQGNEYSIKQIDALASFKFPSGKVTASKFVGEGADRRIQSGRPKYFHYDEVAVIMGEDEDFDDGETNESEPEPKVMNEVVKTWHNLRSADPEKVEGLLSSLPDKSTNNDW